MGKEHVLTAMILNKINDAFDDIEEDIIFLDNSNKLRDQIILEGINFGTQDELKEFVLKLKNLVADDISKISSKINKEINDKI